MVFGLAEVSLGILWFVGFIIYEITEAKTVKDQPCWDIRDFLIGFGVACAALFVRRHYERAKQAILVNSETDHHSLICRNARVGLR